MLRKWQSECAEQAIEKYKTGASHFFCQATPGAGKTTLASEIASRLLKANMIDFILCFAPSLSVVDGMHISEHSDHPFRDYTIADFAIIRSPIPRFSGQF